MEGKTKVVEDKTSEEIETSEVTEVTEATEVTEPTKVILVTTNHNSNQHIISALKTNFFHSCFILDFCSTDDSIRQIIELCLERKIKLEVYTQKKDTRTNIFNTQVEKCVEIVKSEISKTSEFFKTTENSLNNTYIFFLDKNYELNVNGTIKLTEPLYAISETINKNNLFNLRLFKLSFLIDSLSLDSSKDSSEEKRKFTMKTKFYHINNFENKQDIFDIPVLSSENIRLEYKGPQETITKELNLYSELLTSKILDGLETVNDQEILSEKIPSEEVPKLTKEEMSNINLVIARFMKVIVGNQSVDFIINLFLYFNLYFLYNEIDVQLLETCMEIVREMKLSPVIEKNLLWYWNFIILKFFIKKGEKEQIVSYFQKCCECDDRLEQYYEFLSFLQGKKLYDEIYPIYCKSKEVKSQNDTSLRNILFYDSKVGSKISYLSTLFGFYIKEIDNKEIFRTMIDLLNEEHVNYNNIFNNLHYYSSPMFDSSEKDSSNPQREKDSSKDQRKFTITEHQYIIPKKEGYNNSSCCIIPLSSALIEQLNKYFKAKKIDLIDEKSPAKYLINFRYVNYYVNAENGYCIPMSMDGVVNTLNSFALLDSSMTQVINGYFDWNGAVNIPFNPSANIKGLEDVRLFMFNSQLLFTATQKEYSEKIRVLYGKINLAEMKVSTGFVMEPPTDTPCEKNWIPVPFDGKLSFIYTYYPLTIGHLNAKHKLVIDKEYKTPGLWKSMRGSSVPVVNPFDEQELWMLVHMVEYSTPRKYYHSILVLNSKTLKPIRYTVPMSFLWKGVEYALSLNITKHIEESVEEGEERMEEGMVHISFSKFDKESHLINIPFSKLTFLTC